MLRRLLPFASVLVLAACGGGSEEAPEPEAPSSATQTSEAGAPASGNPEEPHERADTAAAIQDEGEEEDEDETDNGAGGDAQAILASLGGDYANADLQNGARQFRRCQSCHTLNEGGRHTVGPNLHDIVGAEAAAAEGFNYSRQLTEAGLVWDVETLDSWIENPRAMVPGNRMSFVGLRDAEDRRDVIGYLAVETAE
ncbi:MAG: c-type cytochrome [Pseudomonadota bacterium]|nr:c-type cytochrome [Pseudomonadota bacterium]